MFMVDFDMLRMVFQSIRLLFLVSFQARDQRLSTHPVSLGIDAGLESKMSVCHSTSSIPVQHTPGPRHVMEGEAAASHLCKNWLSVDDLTAHNLAVHCVFAPMSGTHNMQRVASIWMSWKSRPSPKTTIPAGIGHMRKSSRNLRAWHL